MDVRARIRQIIDGREDLTVRSVSLDAGLSDSLLHKYLTGATVSITVDNLEKVAKVLGVSVSWLVGGEEPKPPSPVINMWDRVPLDQRDHALDVLETFTRKA